MATEISILKERGVFEVVPRLQRKNVVRLKWVYAVKWKEDDRVEKRKAKTATKEFAQVIREDYKETYTLVTRLESVCLVYAVTVVQNLCLWQVDFVSAFLNSDNAFEVYMEKPRGFEKEGDNIWRLQKTLYETM